MANKLVRASKYRHTVGKLEKKDLWYPDLSPANLAQDGAQGIAASTKFIALVWSTGGGGSVGLLPVEATGKRQGPVMQISAHGAEIQDLEFSPHNDLLLATSSDDQSIRVWSIPEGGPKESLSASVSLAGHSKRVDTIRWHPTAGNVLASGSTDGTVKLWDVGASAEKCSVKLGSGEAVQTIAWNLDGSLLATTGKDKFLRVIDPRASDAKPAMEVASHQGVKPSKLCFALGGTKLLSTGFSKARDRQLWIWDTRSLSNSAPVVQQNLDQSPGVLFPLVDQDTGLCVITGKGDGNIRLAELVDDKQVLYELPGVPSDAQHRSVCVLPKRALDVMSAEVIRLLKLTKDAIIPVSFQVPRKSKSDFADDLFPLTASTEPAMTAAEYFSGAAVRAAKTMSLDPAKRKEQAAHAKKETAYAGPSWVGSSQEDKPAAATPAPAAAAAAPSAANAKAAPASSSLGGSDGIVRTGKPVQVVRTSKFRHITGSVSNKDPHFEDMKVNAAADTTIRTNGKLVAVPWVGAGGRVAILPMNASGRYETCGAVETGSNGVGDFDFSPVVADSSLLATALEDGHVKLWKVSEQLSKQKQNLTEFAIDLRGHSRRATGVFFHPTAAHTLCSAAADSTLRFWDLQKASERICVKEVFGEPVQSLSWNFAGSQLVVSTKDKKLHIVDPRAASPLVTSVESHNGAKGINVCWLGTTDRIFTVGSAKSSEREMAVWDSRKMSAGSAPVFCQTIDTGAGSYQPLYDPDTAVMYLAAKGDTSIRYYELTDTEAFLLSGFSSTSPQVGVAPLSKLSCDVTKVELFRVLKLRADNCIETVSFKVPRTRSDLFQDDLYPPTWDHQPVLSADEWFGGQTKPPQMKSLKPANLTALSQAGADTGPKGKRAEAPVAEEKEVGREEVNAALFKQVGTHKEGTETREWQTGGGVAAEEWDEK